MTQDQESDKRPVYLLIVDDSEDFKVALRYTAYLANKNNARVALLHVMDREDFQQWATIQSKLHEEYMREAQELLYSAADILKQTYRDMPLFYLEQGGQLDVIPEIIKNDLSITKFILGGSTKGSSAGPLVSYFTGKGLPKLRVPLIIVPDTIELESLDS